MNTPSFKFKNKLCKLAKNDRETILFKLYNWIRLQFEVDQNASSCYLTIQELWSSHSRQCDRDFKDNYLWTRLQDSDSCISFQEFVKVMGVPQVNIELEIKNINQKPRKAIPKKIRGEIWEIHFGDSIKGSCYCCKKELGAFDDWHAGHIIPHSNGGSDIANNLRPVCGSCNLSMGTENMDEFKKRCYPT